MIPRHALGGLILAGGQARRLQEPGRTELDKGLLELHGMSLAERAARYLSSRVSRLWISANRHADIYQRFGDVVADDPDYGVGSGPLSGVASVLAVASTPWLVVIPVDVPELPIDLVDRLADAALASRAGVAYAENAQGAHPLCMVLHRRVLAPLRAHLLDGERKVRRWQQGQGATAVWFEEEGAAFFNINTREDLCVMRRRAPLE
ncbi:MAG TPA: molybdenum cofactor guanylyltransferase MobA [Burkholderiaceae bacterium]|nr:molybdenum cofactor guanylyltransferase MobA [Burkholderiaceae bacterium]